MVNIADNRDAVSPSRARFNVLLTEDRPREFEHWTNQLSRLLEPQGVASYLVHSGREAIDLAQRLDIHAAVIDMGTPLEGGASVYSASAANEPAGVWLLELFRRLPNRPPMVIVHNTSYSQRRAERVLREALRLGAFSVLNKPVDLEQLLRVFRRLVDRQYRGAWPSDRRPL